MKKILPVLMGVLLLSSTKGWGGEFTEAWDKGDYKKAFQICKPKAKGKYGEDESSYHTFEEYVNSILLR